MKHLLENSIYFVLMSVTDLQTLPFISELCKHLTTLALAYSGTLYSTLNISSKYLGEEHCEGKSSTLTLLAEALVNPMVLFIW